MTLRVLRDQHGLISEPCLHREPTHMPDLFRVFLRLTWKPLLTRLAPIWVGIGVFFAVFQQVLDFPLYQQMLEAQTPLEHGLFWSALCLVWAIAISRHLRHVLYQAPVRWLWRQPISSQRWGFLLAPLVFTAALPIAVIGLFPRDGVFLFQALSLLGFSAPVVVALGRRTVRGFGWGLCFLGVAGLLTALGQYERLFWLPISIVSMFGGPWAAGWVYGDLRGRRDWQMPPIIKWRPASPLTALIHRDLVCLWRAHRNIVLASLFACLSASLVAFGICYKGGQPDVTTWVMLTLASPLSGLIVIRLDETLGRRLYLGSWAIGVRMRILSLVIIASLPLAVVLVLNLALIRGIGLFGLFISLTLFAALVLGQVTTSLWAPFRESAKVYMLFGALFLLMAIFKSPLAAVVIHLTLAGASTLCAAHLLERRRYSYE